MWKSHGVNKREARFERCKEPATEVNAAGNWKNTRKSKINPQRPLETNNNNILISNLD